MKRYGIFLTSIFLLTLIFLKAQRPPCMPNDPGVTYEFDTLSHFPPYTLGMPYDIMIGYYAIDTVARNASEEMVEEFINRQTYNDTIKTIMKYYYELVDYNPTTFLLVKNYLKCPYGIATYPRDMEYYFLKKIKSVLPNPNLDYSLLGSTYIAQLNVIDTMTVIDSNGVMCREKALVKCEIVDQIKGQIIPQCKTWGEQQLLINNSPVRTASLSIPALPGSCFTFDYCPDWREVLHGEHIPTNSKSLLRDSLGKPIIKKGKQYIIFLQAQFLCFDRNTKISSYVLLPMNNNLFYSIYPIENGFVKDPNNFMGWGTSVSLNTFKNNLRTRISQIKNP